MSHHILYSIITAYYVDKSKQVALKYMNSKSPFPTALISNIFHVVIKQEAVGNQKYVISNNERSGPNRASYLTTRTPFAWGDILRPLGRLDGENVWVCEYYTSEYFWGRNNTA